MKIVNFKGGLGNQIAIYLFSQWLQRCHPGERIYGAYWSNSLREHGPFVLDKIFDISLPPHTPLTDVVSKVALWMETHGMVSTEEGRHSIFYNGFWLDKKYFGDYRKSLRFRHAGLSGDNLAYRKMMEEGGSCSVHVRRGDYQSAENKAKFGDFCTLDYYRKAIAEMVRAVPGVRFFVFSDDMAWAKRHLPLGEAVYVTGNEGDDSWKDLYLMSLCEHNIIANSTFSFWAAMLNSNPRKKVFYPRRWYIWENPDIFPDEWKAL